VDYEAFTRDLKADLRANGRITSGPMEGRPSLILSSTGAKSGETHEAVLNYTRDGDAYVIAASKGGAPTNPNWYHNLRAHPEVMVEVDREAFRARAVIAESAERDRLWNSHAATLPWFREYPSKTDRVIPVISLTRLD
jgi:deazaflavin-dependent oxidoreductase (nitroreductase family)